MLAISEQASKWLAHFLIVTRFSLSVHSLSTGQLGSFLLFHLHMKLSQTMNARCHCLSMFTAARTISCNYGARLEGCQSTLPLCNSSTVFLAIEKNNFFFVGFCFTKIGVVFFLFASVLNGFTCYVQQGSLIGTNGAYCRIDCY